MDVTQKVLFVDARTGYYRVGKYPVGDFFGPVDLGLHLAGRFNSLNIGVGLLAGSILPGSNRLVVTGFSPCWGGFYVSSMGGAGLVFDNLGINMLSIVGSGGHAVGAGAQPPARRGDRRRRSSRSTCRACGRRAARRLRAARRGARHGTRRATRRPPRILAVGPAAEATDFGAIGSVPIDGNGALTHVDTWAGRGGFGTQLLRDHNIAAVIYGGTFVDEDFRDRKVADEWFQVRYPEAAGREGLRGDDEVPLRPEAGDRRHLRRQLRDARRRDAVVQLPQHLHERGRPRGAAPDAGRSTTTSSSSTRRRSRRKQQHTCGEPCAAVCKKMRGEFKKDYEPYETMGPQCGIFDQRAAETLAHHADALGFDAISAGGVLSWLMECLHEGRAVARRSVGVEATRRSSRRTAFRVVEDSAHNAGARRGAARRDRREAVRPGAGRRGGARAAWRGRRGGRCSTSSSTPRSRARAGWCRTSTGRRARWRRCPSWASTTCTTAPTSSPPRQLGRLNAERMVQELLLDNLGICRFHRGWAEEMGAEIVRGALRQGQASSSRRSKMTASRINSRNSSVFWEAGRNADLVYDVPEAAPRRRRARRGRSCDDWIAQFETDRREAALDFWYEMHKGAHESLLGILMRVLRGRGRGWARGKMGGHEAAGVHLQPHRRDRAGARPGDAARVRASRRRCTGRCATR